MINAKFREYEYIEFFEYVKEQGDNKLRAMTHRRENRRNDKSNHHALLTETITYIYA